MIDTPTQTGHPAPGNFSVPTQHYVITDGDGTLLEDSLYTFQAAIDEALAQSGPTDDFEALIGIWAIPDGYDAFPLNDIQSEGKLVAIVFRQVVLVPCTGRAISPAIPPTPWVELQRQVKDLELRVTSMAQDLHTLYANTRVGTP